MSKRKVDIVKKLNTTLRQRAEKADKIMSKMYDVLQNDDANTLAWYLNPKNFNLYDGSLESFNKEKARFVRQFDTQVKKLNKLMTQLNGVA